MRRRLLFWDCRLFGFSYPVTHPGYEVLRQNQKNKLILNI